MVDYRRRVPQRHEPDHLAGGSTTDQLEPHGGYRLGDCELFFLRDGAFWLDGGAYFGVVPKPLWEKIAQPDAQNRVRLCINPLLVRTPEHLVLIDPGLGDKWSDRQREIYCIERTPSLQESLALYGFSPKDIEIVIATHLHFDHVGACTVSEQGGVVPAFPNARHYFQRGEWEDAVAPNERTRAAYQSADFVPLQQSGLVELIDGPCQIVPHVTVEVTGGHTRCHQVVFIECQGQKAVYLGGILPATSHMPIAYTMGFDLYPMTVMDTRRALYRRAAAERWLVCLEHDCAVPAGHIALEGEKFVFQPLTQERAEGRQAQGKDRGRRS
ncbi:MAG: MBL fold metallo-hydrolase [Candidatus Oleimicrobiaceae bacterium]